MLSWLSSNQNEMPCRGNVSAGQLLVGMGELKISFSAGNCRIMTIFVSLHELINTDYVMGTEGIQDKYVNPYTDFGFKLLFGTAMNKELLISFLNALLFGEETVKDVTYMNTEHLGTQEYDRRAIFDVYCENEKGEKFLVEMQRGEQ